MKTAAFVWRDDLTTYKLSTTHPLNPIRLEATLDLLKMTGALRSDDVVTCEPASDDTIALVHSRDYIDAVATLSESPSEALTGEQQLHGATYGFGSADNPIFKGMHAASSLVCGASVRAAELVMSGEAKRAFNVAGGLHHALKDRAAGFCIYNDPAVAIGHLRQKYDARVAYIDIDAHHGDGVQWLFYDDPNVLTVSIHESGHFLFPGTGHVNERGEGPAAGTSVNIPLAPETNTASWLASFEAVVPAVLRRFKPDVIITQHGCDAHTWDPLTHLAVTTTALEQAAMSIRNLADELCEGRWIATGGGGYALFAVVPRAWTLLWNVMAERDVPGEVPEQWLNHWEPHAALAGVGRIRSDADVKKGLLPRTMRDDDDDFPTGAAGQEATASNERMLSQLKEYVPALRG